MPTAKTPLKAYLSEDERRLVAARAAQARLSVSTYAKRLCLGYEIKSRVEERAVLELIRLGGNFGRIGGLLKNALKDGSLGRTAKINKLIDDLATAKQEIMTKVHELGK